MPAVPDDNQSELPASTRDWQCARARARMYGQPRARIRSAATGFLAFGILFQNGALSQSPSLPAQSPEQTETAQNSGAVGQPVPPVTTTVVVHGNVKDDYLPQTVTAGTLDGAPLSETPLSVTVVTRDLLTDQVSRLLSDVVKNDASIGEDYAPVGYYGDFQIRGFPNGGIDYSGQTLPTLSENTLNEGPGIGSDVYTGALAAHCRGAESQARAGAGRRRVPQL